jgi:hypothetical protein
MAQITANCTLHWLRPEKSANNVQNMPATHANLILHRLIRTPLGAFELGQLPPKPFKPAPPVALLGSLLHLDSRQIGNVEVSIR